LEIQKDIKITTKMNKEKLDFHNFFGN